VCVGLVDGLVDGMLFATPGANQSTSHANSEFVACGHTLWCQLECVRSSRVHRQPVMCACGSLRRLCFAFVKVSHANCGALLSSGGGEEG
jgi:hypothetical protein